MADLGLIAIVTTFSTTVGAVVGAFANQRKVTADIKAQAENIGQALRTELRDENKDLKAALEKAQGQLGMTREELERAEHRIEAHERTIGLLTRRLEELESVAAERDGLLRQLEIARALKLEAERACQEHRDLAESYARELARIAACEVDACPFRTSIQKSGPPSTS